MWFEGKLSQLLDGFEKTKYDNYTVTFHSDGEKYFVWDEGSEVLGINTSAALGECSFRLMSSAEGHKKLVLFKNTVMYDLGEVTLCEQVTSQNPYACLSLETLKKYEMLCVDGSRQCVVMWDDNLYLVGEDNSEEFATTNKVVRVANVKSIFRSHDSWHDGYLEFVNSSHVIYNL